MEVRFDYRPLAIHRPFHASSARRKCLFGAFGSGKTYALCAEAIALALEQPGSDILICRKTIGELRDTTETVFLRIMPTDLFKACFTSRTGGHYERIVFPNGSNVRFRGIDDWVKHRSLNVCAIFYDEADEFDEETIEGMESRVRQRDLTKEAIDRGYTGNITRRFTCFASNPRGRNWLYRYFIDPREKKPNSEWFRSTSFDNPYLSRDYIESLLDKPEPWIRRYVLCQFDEFGGQIYDDWDWDTHVIEPPREGWGSSAVYWMGMDPGLKMTAGLWVVHDREHGRYVGVAEYQRSGLAAKEHTDAWRSLEARHKMTGQVRMRIADPAIAARDRGTNNSLQDIYRRLGFNFQHGAKFHRDRIPALGQLIHLRKFVVTKDCPMTFDQIRDYKWEDITPIQRAKGYKEGDGVERPVKVNDHLVDAAQYLASRWSKPLEMRAPRIVVADEDMMTREIYATIKRQIQHRSVTQMDVGMVI